MKINPLTWIYKNIVSFPKVSIFIFEVDYVNLCCQTCIVLTNWMKTSFGNIWELFCSVCGCHFCWMVRFVHLPPECTPESLLNARCNDVSYHNSKCSNWSKSQAVCWFGHFMQESCGNLAKLQALSNTVEISWICVNYCTHKILLSWRDCFIYYYVVTFLTAHHILYVADLNL